MPVSMQQIPIGSALTTPVRALAVTYQNLTGRPLIVIAYVSLTIGAGAGNAICQALVENVSPPTVVQGLAQLQGTLASDTASMTIVLFVPNGWYYRFNNVSTGTGNVILTHVTEIALIEPITSGL